MDHNSALDRQLRSLSEATGTDADEMSAWVRTLTSRLTTAIPSFLGLTVTVVGPASQITLTAVGPASAHSAPRTSLRFSILHQPGGHVRIVIYARQPGALVDLDADLNHLVGHRPPGAEDHAPTATDSRLDRDLVPAALVPGFTGLDEQSTLHRAEGVLIDHGEDPDHAAAQLQQRAVAAGVNVHQYALQLLAARTAQR